MSRIWASFFPHYFGPSKKFRRVHCRPQSGLNCTCEQVAGRPARHVSGIFRAQEIWTVRSVTDSRLSPLRGSLSPRDALSRFVSSSSRSDRLSPSLHGVDGCRRGPAPQELPRRGQRGRTRQRSAQVNPPLSLSLPPFPPSSARAVSIRVRIGVASDPQPCHTVRSGIFRRVMQQM